MGFNSGFKGLNKRVPKCSFVDRKRNKTKVKEEYCSAITQAAGQSCCGPSGSSVVEFGFKMDSFVYMRSVHEVSELSS